MSSLIECPDLLPPEYSIPMNIQTTFHVEWYGDLWFHSYVVLCDHQFVDLSIDLLLSHLEFRYLLSLLIFIDLLFVPTC